MIVHCETCQTDFQLDESQLPSEGAWVRCGVCGDTFHVEAVPAEPPAGHEEKPEATAPPQEAGQDEPEEKPWPEVEEQPPAAAEAPEPAAPPEPGPPAWDHLDLQDYHDVDQDRAQQLARFGLEESPPQSEPGRSSLFKVGFWVIGGIILAAIALLGSIVIMSRMGVAEPLVQQFQNVPGIAPLLGKHQASKAKRAAGEAVQMTLSDVRGFFRNNETAGKLFVIQGKVENHHPQVRSAILVQGTLHDGHGKMVRRANSYAGSVFTPEELRFMSLSAIKQRLGSPEDAAGKLRTVEPGGAIPFMIVMANLPSQMLEFTAEVVSSQAVSDRAGAGQ